MPDDHPIKVLWLIKGLGPGGSERLLVAAAGAHDPRVVSLTCAYVLAHKDHLVGDLERAGVPCICLSGTASRSWPVRLRTLVRREKPDIVHIHSPLTGAVARLVLRTVPTSTRPKVVTTEHNALGSYPLPLRWLSAWTRRWDDASIAVSAEARTSLTRRERERTLVLIHGIALDQVRAAATERNAMRTEFSLAESDFVIGTIANFRRQKDYPNVLNAAAILRSKGVTFRWLFVGQGPLESEARARSTALGLDDIVVFTGYRADAERVLAGCDMFVLGSSWEGLPVALMEALALNLPVVATSVGGMAQVLTNQQDALLVPPRNAPALARAIEQMVSDPGLRRRIARGGQRLSNTFDVRRVTDELEAIYAGLVDPTSRLGAEPGKQAATTSHSQRNHSQRNHSQRGESVEIRPVQTDDQESIVRLFEQTLDWGDDPRNQAFFEWKHQLNPRGPSPTWVAIAGDEIVGVRTFLQWQFGRGDQQLSAARAVDTAIDPRYRRRGIFRELTMHGVDELTDRGVDFIFNTPNKFSRPGYLSLGWREVGRLPLALRMRVIPSPTLATALVPAQRWSDRCEIGVAASAWLDNGGFQRAPSDAEYDVRSLSTVADEAFIRWRYGHHLVPYRVVEDGRATIIVRTRRRGRARELVMAHAFGDPRDTDRLLIEALHETRSSYALRLGPAHSRRGIVSLPNGPRLLWRELGTVGMPPLANWRLSLGDVELM